MEPYAPINLLGWGTMVDYNIFTNPEAFEEAQNLGIDKHSIVSAVEFKNPSAGDFSVSGSASAIFRLGYQNFNMICFGVISPELKRQAEIPRITWPKEQAIVAAPDTVEWQGWLVMNLKTLGERSATGMNSERGVYLISMAYPDSGLKDLLRENDVILMFDEILINNLDELLAATNQAELSKQVEILVFRNQRETVVTVPGKMLQAGQPETNILLNSEVQ